MESLDRNFFLSSSRILIPLFLNLQEKSKAMSDFGGEEYLRMVCVEAGAVAPVNQITVDSNSELIGRMVLSVEEAANSSL